MSRFTDPQYLKTDQYRDSSNLDARVEIHKRFSTNSYGWMHWVFDRLLALPANAKILELGCGPGYLWMENASRLPSTWDITLSDLSAGMIDSAWRNLVVTGRNYKFKEIDAQEIPFEDGTFDAVIANHMLYHVPDRPKALAEIRRVLKDNGKFMAATVGGNHLNEMGAWIRRASMEPRQGKFTQLFTLENGGDQLRAFFSNVTVDRYEDNLKVTEVAPLLDYVRSMISVEQLSIEELAKLDGEFQDMLTKDGEIFITKDSGLFEAKK
jgi:ubiquinone/menaquinone biosynthesis C-methylase UbiE